MSSVAQHIATSTSAVQKTTTVLGQRQRNALRLLTKSLPELRAEIANEMAANPAIEDFDHPLETPLSEIERQQKLSESESLPDYPEDETERDLAGDEAAAERRQRFFDNQVASETLHQHLLAQLPTSEIPSGDWPLATVLIGDFDDDGFYRGSIPDACMNFGKTEEAIREILARLRTFDPPGCGATTARECLLAQIDSLSGKSTASYVRALIDKHLADVAAGKHAEVAQALGLSMAAYRAVLEDVRSLDPHPGRAFPSEHDRAEYMNPEVHAQKIEGHWYATTDRRSLPKLRLSPQFLDMLKRTDLDEATRAYIRERIESAKALGEAISARCDTVEAVSQAIFDRQQEFFEKGFPALKPLTETEVAKTVGVHPATVSRTVCGKYASTPFGTVELRAFCVAGVTNAAGESVTQDAVLQRLKGLVEAEDKAQPLSDERLAAALSAAGFPIARRTVAKYRDKLSIPGAAARKQI